MDNHHGYLELILGPMFSGKTSKLLEVYKQYTFCNIPICVINHIEDTRYQGENKMVTHDQKSIPCINCTSLQDAFALDDELHKETLSAVLINEGQFFPDLYNFVCVLLTHKKHVYVCGLDGDFQRKKFGSILDLIPLCDSVHKLNSLCVYCKNGTKAIFSHRIDNKTTEQKQIGASDKYIPLCRKCYMTDNQD